MIVIVGLLGLCIGSFLNVLIWRLNDPKAPRFWQGRSICPKCRAEISWLDNVPLLSFVLLHGRCRHCKKPISWQYPAVETITALTFVLLAQFGKFNIMDAGIASAFIVIFFSDLIYGLIPDEMIAAATILWILSNLGNLSLLGNLVVAAATTLPFFVLARLKKMGYGDVTLAFMMGLVLGFPKIVVALWSGFILGGLTAGVLLLLKKTKLSATIALGPFLIIGVLISALWSDRILSMLGFF